MLGGNTYFSNFNIEAIWVNDAANMLIHSRDGSVS